MKERKLTCIICPRGCNLKVTLSDTGEVTEVVGNACRRGVGYAEAECTNPTRTVTSTVRTEGGKTVPVKTSKPIPKKLMFEAMLEINKTKARDSAKIGDVVIKSLLGTDADVVVTANAENCE